MVTNKCENTTPLPTGKPSSCLSEPATGFFTEHLESMTIRRPQPRMLASRFLRTVPPKANQKTTTPPRRHWRIDVDALRQRFMALGRRRTVV